MVRAGQRETFCDDEERATQATAGSVARSLGGTHVHDPTGGDSSTARGLEDTTAGRGLP